MTSRLYLRSLLIFALALFATGPSHAFETTKLTNGLTVITEEDHSVELVGVDVWVRAGSGCESATSSGVAHIVEHLVFGATSKRKAGQMDLEMESVGATLDARTSQDWAHYSTTVSSRHLEKALDVLHDAVANPAFNKLDVDRERLVVLDEIAHKQSQPFAVCQDYLAALLYGNHPYSRPIEGTPESVRALTRESLLAHHKAYYHPGNMAVVLVGDIDKAKALESVARIFSEPPGPAQFQTDRSLPSPPSKQLSRSIKAPYKHTYIGYAFLGPVAADYSGVCATDVLLTYLGLGYRSWLSATLKGKLGLAEDVSADYLTHRDPGMITLVAAVNESNMQKAKEAMIGEIARVKLSGLSDGELATAKRSLLGQFAFDSETYAGRANSLGFYFAVSDVDFSRKYAAGIDAVTNDDVIRAARKYLDLEHSAIITLGPSAGGDQ